MFKKGITTLCVVMVLLSGCAASNGPSSDVPSSLPESTASLSSSISPAFSESQKVSQESDAVSETVPFSSEKFPDEPFQEEPFKWITLDSLEFSNIDLSLITESDIPTSYLYVTDSQGKPVSNIMCYLPSEGYVLYSMPCGLIPMMWLRGPECNPMKVALANSNTDGTNMFQWYEDVELDMTGGQAYHLVWDMEQPDDYAQKSENSITVSLKYEDGTPASGIFAYLGLTIPASLRKENEELNPAIGSMDLPEEIPNGIIGSDGYQDFLDRGRYSDAQGNLFFVLDANRGDTERTYLQLRIYENAAGRIISTKYHPYVEVPLYDGNGLLQHFIEVTIPKIENESSSGTRQKRSS